MKNRQISLIWSMTTGIRNDKIKYPQTHIATRICASQRQFQVGIRRRINWVSSSSSSSLLFHGMSRRLLDMHTYIKHTQLFATHFLFCRQFILSSNRIKAVSELALTRIVECTGISWLVVFGWEICAMANYEIRTKDATKPQWWDAMSVTK